MNGRLRKWVGGLIWPLLTIPVIGALGLPLAIDLLLLLALIVGSKLSLRVMYANVAVLAGLFLLAIEIPVRLVLDASPFYRPQDLYSEVELIRNPGHQRRYLPNIKTEFHSPHGDLVAIGGKALFVKHPHLIQSRSLRFETDEFGYRNAKGSAKVAEIVLVGDSFVAGDGLDQDDILVSQIKSITGTKAYSVAFPDDPAGYSRRLHEAAAWLKPGLPKIFFLFAGNDFQFASRPSVQNQGPSETPIYLLLMKQLSAKGAYTRLLHQRLGLKSPMVLNNVFTGLLATYGRSSYDRSDVSIVSGQKTKRDFALYQPYLENAKRSDVGKISLNFPLPPNQAAGTRCVILIPSKEQLYLALEGGLSRDSILVSIIKQQQIFEPQTKIIDLLPVFEAEARRTPGRLLFLPDDTHWTPDAVRLTVRHLEAQACL